MSVLKEPMVQTLPLLFTYRDVVFGDGFVAEVVATNGRAVCVHEDDRHWFYGVNPGGMAASGASADDAHLAFRVTFRNVLADFADSAETFEDFRQQVERFFQETNDPAERDWQEAVEAVRAGKVSVDGVLVKPADSPRSIAFAYVVTPVRFFTS